MSSIVCFHAHPDDEAIASGGTIAKLVAEGHRVTVVFATRGEVGEVGDGFLPPDTTLGQVREAEAHKAAEILGVQQIEFLGYKDSGMENIVEVQSKNKEFCNADPQEAGQRLAGILDETDADIVTTYDPNGGYGHPDHIQVHQVGNIAAQLARKKPRILWVTMNSEHFMRLRETNEEVRKTMDNMSDIKDEKELEGQMTKDRTDTGGENKLGNSFGWAEAKITHFIEVSDYLEQKMESMMAHASQIGEDSFFMKLSPDDRKATIGVEWFVDPQIQVPNTRKSSIFE